MTAIPLEPEKKPVKNRAASYREKAAALKEKRDRRTTDREIPPPHPSSGSGLIKARADVEALVDEQHARLEYLWGKLKEKIDKGCGDGLARNVEVGIKLMERMAKLRGLDAPEKKQIQIDLHDVPDEDLLEEARRMGFSIAVKEFIVPRLLPGEETPPPIPASPFPESRDIEDAEIVPPEIS